MSGRSRSDGARIPWPERAVGAALPWLEAILERVPSDAERASLANGWCEADALNLLLGASAVSGAAGEGAPTDECRLGPGSRARILATSRSLRVASSAAGQGARVVETGVYECHAWLAARGADGLAAAVVVNSPGGSQQLGDGARNLAATLSAVGIPWVALQCHREAAAGTATSQRLDLFMIGRCDDGAIDRSPRAAGKAGEGGALGMPSASGAGARAVREGDRIALILPVEAPCRDAATPADIGTDEARQRRAACHRRWANAVRTAVRARGMQAEAIATGSLPWSVARRILRRHAADFGFAMTSTSHIAGSRESGSEWVAIASPETEPELAEWFATVGLEWIGVGRVGAPAAPAVARGLGETDTLSLPTALLDGPSHAVLGTQGERGAEAGTTEVQSTEPGGSGDAGDPDLGLVRVAEESLAAGDPRLLSRIDWLAGGRTMVSPGGGAGIVRWCSDEPALALVVRSCPRYERLDPYVASCIALGEAARSLVASGAEPLAMWAILGLSSDSPMEAELARAQQAAAGLRDAAHGRRVGLLGTRLHPSPPAGESAGGGTSVAGIGRLVCAEPLRPWFRAPGDVVVVLGRAREELGASLYGEVVPSHEGNGITGPPPWVDLEAERLLAEVVLRAAERGLLRSAHSIAEGGLGGALMDCCAGDPMESGGLGARIRLEEGMAPIAGLFGESQARMLVSVRRTDQNVLRDLAREAGVYLSVIGQVTDVALEIDDLAAVSVTDLRRLRASGMPWAIPEHAGGGVLEKPGNPG